MSQRVTEIMTGIEALPEEERQQLLQQLNWKYAGEHIGLWRNELNENSHIPKEGKEVNQNIELQEANRKVDQVLPDLWVQAERNLKEAEAEYKRKKGEK
ncbi:hypothetical protein GCM10010912_58470 [Paenibacillus albidus]|uniref:Uncharacterized protein n=1 Tax=Paenibacillus albidus TaxID=2041023 RepID=A0A917FW36_9BACL|nr:hypothetical protein [Paenibacillus albidus]GGG06157.1 hypothetical protein GCM10010912_58470 [Paenibacillus albidus]